MKDNQYKKYIYAALSLFCVIAASLLLFFVLFRLEEIGKILKSIISTLMPFIIGAVLAYIICPMCNKLETLFNKIFRGINNDSRKQTLSRTLSVFSGILITIIVIYVTLIIVIPQLINSVVRIVQILPESTDKMVAWLQTLLSSNEELLKYSQDAIDKGYKFIENWLSNGLLDSLQNLATGLSSGVFNIVTVILNIFIGFIVAIYLLLSRGKLARQAKLIIYSIFKENIADRIMNEIRYADRVFSGFINGKILDAVIIAIICYIGTMCFHIFSNGPFMSEVLVAVIVGIFNIIRFFGWYMGLIISAILILLVNPIQCLYFVIFDIILQQIDGNILGPKIIGNTTGISSFWVLFSILLFGDLWGFAGMLIGVPVFAVIYHGIETVVFRSLRKKGRKDMVEEYRRDYPDKTQDGISEGVKDEVRDVKNFIQNHFDKEDFSEQSMKDEALNQCEVSEQSDYLKIIKKDKK